MSKTIRAGDRVVATQNLVEKNGQTILVHKDGVGTVESVDVSMPCPILVEWDNGQFFRVPKYQVRLAQQCHTP